ncbi:hypothetical protein FRC06_010241, partial [Ceratobasidium sp. 370]
MTGSIISQVSTYVEHLTATRYLTFAGYVVLLYDHLLTLGDEIELVWSRPGNIVSVIFLANRYTTPLVLAVDVYDKGGLARHLTTPYCRTWFIMEGYLNLCLLASVHGKPIILLPMVILITLQIAPALMLMRANALWGNSTRMRRGLVAAYILYLTSTFALLTAGLFQTVVT